MFDEDAGRASSARTSRSSAAARSCPTATTWPTDGDVAARRRAVPGQLLVLPRASAAAAARCPPASTRPPRATPPTGRSTRRCSPARRTCRCSATTSSRPSEKRDIIAYVQYTLQGRQGPGRLSAWAGYGPVHRGPGDLPGRHRRAGLRDAVDCGEVMTRRAPTTARRRRRRAGRRRRPAADPVRPGPRGRPARRRRDRPLRAAVPGAGHQGREARRPHRSRCCSCSPACPRPRSWSSTSGGRGSTSSAHAADEATTRRCSALTLGPGAVRLGVGDPHLGARSCCPRRSSVQDRHDGGSSADEQRAHRRDAGHTWSTRLGIQRRPLLKGALAAGPGAGRRWSRPRR